MRMKYIHGGRKCMWIVLVSTVLFNGSCRKFIEIPPPVSSITTSQVFADSINALSAISGIYYKIALGAGIQFGNGAITVYTGASSDELVPFNLGGGDESDIYRNNLIYTNSVILYSFWVQPYSLLYQANACIEAAKASNQISTTVKNQVIGEAKFFRAYIYFYLVNLFGDVPLVLSTDYKVNQRMSRTPKEQVYRQIVEDLIDAKKLIIDDFFTLNGERTRISQSAAGALLSRIYLYVNDWKNAESQATILINNAQFSLEEDLNKVFLRNSSESILQWGLSSIVYPYNATSEGAYFIMNGTGQPPSYYLSDELLDSFEPGDQRKVAWTDSVLYDGTVYYYPFKYKIGVTQSDPNAELTEYYMVLRLAEQYLIRAEARAHLGETSLAIQDINTIRNRAGLPDYSGNTDEASLLKAIAHERQIELFAEWAHRWLDLKRTGQISNVMSQIAPKKKLPTVWNSTQQLYPIPENEMKSNPMLIQNPGY